MADLEKLSKQEILELSASVAIQLLAGVFRTAQVPPVQALKFIVKASGLNGGEMENLDKFLTSYAMGLGKAPQDLTTLDVMTGVFMTMVEQRLEPPKPPEAFGSSVVVEETTDGSTVVDTSTDNAEQP